MRTAIAALLSGLIFGIGLALSQMISPAKVLAFLDFGAIATGGWDPSLAFVMAGALAVAGLGFRIAQRRTRPLDGGNFAAPPRRDIDARLVVGALVFGAGWGLVGFCPGPAVASLAFGAAKSFLFVAAMLAGMALHRFAVPAPSDRAPASAA
jgi:uncharacterized membrane protein YedE/YeeE